MSVKVRPLVWKSHDSVAIISDTVFGPYLAETCGAGEFRAWLPDDKGLSTRMIRGFDTIEEAKSAAQDDYEIRIILSLENS